MSYNADVVPPEVLEETNTTRAMTYLCQDFLTAPGIMVEFDNLCANASLKWLVMRRVPQYPKLTYYFVNWFRYNHRASTVEFKIYDDVLIMPLAEFCDTIGV